MGFRTSGRQLGVQVALIFGCVAAGCGGYDSKLISGEDPTPDNPRSDGGSAGVGGSAGSDAAVDGGGIAGSGGSTGGHAGMGGGEGGSGAPVTMGCKANPGDAKCPEICAEVCNGQDDDCDGKTDEEKPAALCMREHAKGVCNEGVCLIVDCRQGYRDCDHKESNGCETSEDDPENCGTCGHVCKIDNASAACEAGKCVVGKCEPGWGDCDKQADDCETELNTLQNCGKCGGTCKDVPNAFASCSSGECGVDTCKPGFGDCDKKGNNGCEQSLDTLEHCNACETPCALASCGGGVCTAVDCSTMPGMADCNADGASCETNLLMDVDNCVACGAACGFNAGVTPRGSLVCTASGCDVSCDSGYGDCDGDYRNGCETPLNTVQNCGMCGSNCNALANTATTSCDAGTLTCKIGSCDANYSDCDGTASTGCEADLRSVQNCGGCANKGQNQPCQGLSNANTSCSTGSCVISSCSSSSWANCDATVSNGCEHDARAPASGGLGPCLPESNCTKWSSTGHDYYYCPTARTWSDARSKCQLQLRGDLLQVVDATEKNLVQPHVAATAWMGDNDSLVEGVWVWANNKMPFWQGTSTGAALLSQYGNWASGEPNASGDCGAMYTNGTYDDTDCASAHPFLCEVSPDGCPSDSSKNDPGQCGCGMADTDADNDSFAVCNDGCPSDTNKRAAGVCGCGVADTNTDGDAQPDCMDGCPTDAAKIAPGTCGCGMPDADSDNDGTFNCMDGCPSDPTVTTACFPFTTSNFDPKPINWSATPTTTLNCGTTTVNTSTTPATISNWCGTAPTPVVQTQASGPNVVVLPLQGFTLSSGATLRVIGTLPVVIAVRGNVSIAGVLDANASAGTPGAGGNWSCGNSTGKDGTGQNDLEGGGGGGGGFGTAGGTGGDDSGSATPGAAGVARGNATLIPLYGGCGGGHGGGCAGTPGAGGGAIEISASGSITVTGTIRANGGAGAQGCDNDAGGTGGGSGGAILLQSSTRTTTGSTITANGANGGRGQSGGNGGNGATSASANGTNGGNGGGSGGGGGGGGYGRIRIQ
jgi:hypothetical protein